MQLGDVIGEVTHMAIGARILEQRTKDRFGVHLVGVANDHLDPQRFGAGFYHRDVLRVAVAVHKEGLCLRLGHALRHGHRFGAGGCLVQQRCVGDLQTGEIRNHRLEVQQRLKATLRDLGLVGRIGRVPRGIFQNVALDRGRGHGAVIALTDQRGHHLVLACDLTHVKQQLALGHRATKVQRRFQTDGFRHGLVDQRIKAVGTNHLEHLGHFLGRGADMAPVGKIIGKVICRFERHLLPPSGSVRSRDQRHATTGRARPVMPSQVKDGPAPDGGGPGNISR